MAGILGNAPTASKSGGGILFKKQQEKVSVQGSKKQTLAEQKLHSLPKPPTYSGIDDIAVAKAEKFGTKQVGTSPFQTPAKLIPDIGTTKGVLNTLGKTFEAFKSGGKVSREGMLNLIKARSEMPREQVLQAEQEFASSPAGAFGYGMSDRTLGLFNRLFMGDAWGNLVKAGEQAQPGYSTAGKIAGDVFMYSTVGKAAEGLKGLEGIKNPFLRNLVGQQLADTAVQTPGVVLRGITDKKSAGEIAKDVGIQQGQDLAGNLIMSGIEAGVKAIFKKLKAGKALAQADVDTVQKATKQMGGDPTASVDDQLKKLDDYFQQKRADPLGGTLPKAEPKPIGGELPKTELSSLPEPAAKVNLNTMKPKKTQNLYTTIVDSQNPIVKMSKESGDKTATLASNTRNVGGTVDYILKEGLVDNQGNKIGESLQEVAKKIPKGKEQSFWDYMMQRGNIDRAREGKAIISNYTPEMSMKAAKIVEAVNPEFKQIGDNVTNWIDQFMKTWGVDAGTVDETLYKQLRETYVSYVPTQREFSELEKAIPGSISRKFVDQATPIQRAGVSDRNIKNPIENIMGLVNRTVRTAKYNEVGQELLQTVRMNPTKMAKFAEIIPAADGMFSNVDNIVTVLEGGKPIYLKINDKALLESLEGLPKAINNLPGMRKVTGVFKSLITQKNPLFAVRNVARDIPTAYVYGSTTNPLKFTKDYVGALKDVATDSPRFQKYRAIGGGGSNFFKQGSTVADDLIKGKNVLQKIGGAIEDVNNALETAPRLAEFNRTLRNTGDIDKALFAANDVTVNFARGGNLTKSAEPLVPYLNAGVQGLDKLFRTFKDPKTAVKALAAGGIGITTPTVALYMLNKDNPHYKELDNRTKDNYFLIPSTDKDENGYSKTFIKIPKSRELGVLFGVLFERALRQKDGDNEAWKGVGGLKGTVATNFSPTNPLESNFFSPILNLKTNKDFADRNIVPQGMIMDKRSPYLQYDERTTEIAKKIGELSAKGGGDGLSPKQIDYLVRSYTGIIGQLGIPLATKGGDPIKAVTTQFISDPLYSSQTVTDFYDNYDKLQKKATDKNITEQLPTSGKQNIVTDEEKLRNQFAKVSAEISKINKEIKEIESMIISKKEKEKRVRELRQKIQDIAKEANESLK